MAKLHVCQDASPESEVLQLPPPHPPESISSPNSRTVNTSYHTTPSANYCCIVSLSCCVDIGTYP